MAGLQLFNGFVPDSNGVHLLPHDHAGTPRARGRRSSGAASSTMRGRRPRSERHIVVALLSDLIAPFELGVVHEVFGLERAELGHVAYDLRLAGTGDTPVEVKDGDWTIDTPWRLDAVAAADTVVIPTWRRDGGTRREVLEAVQDAHRRGARIVAVCTGAFLLAEAGLLDGRRATTHWMYAELLAKRHPSVEVDPDVLFVDAGDGLFTSAGTAAGIDLCLHIVRQDHGAETANTIARRMVVPPQRDGGQAQFVANPVPELPADDSIAVVLDWAAANLDQAIYVEDLARHALLSPRTFARRFKEATGTTPMRWLARQRVLHAQRLLERSDLPVDEVARRCGFGSATALRTNFRRSVGTSPLGYRRTFATAARQ